jgi:hypothetical protein
LTEYFRCTFVFHVKNDEEKKRIDALALSSYLNDPLVALTDRLNHIAEKNGLALTFKNGDLETAYITARQGENAFREGTP